MRRPRLYRRDNIDVEQIMAVRQLRALGDRNPARRRSAMENLANSQPDNFPQVVPAFAAAAGDDDWQVRLTAVQLLGRAIEKSVKARYGTVVEDVDLATRALVRAMKDPRDEVRREAAKSLGEVHAIAEVRPATPGGGPALVPTSQQIHLAARALVGAFTDERPAVRIAAAASLGARFHRSGRISSDRHAGRVAAMISPAMMAEMKPALSRMMGDPVPEVRAAAVGAFARMAPASEGPDVVVRMMVNDPEAHVRAAAIEALSSGWSGPELFFILLRRLKEPLSVAERYAIASAFRVLPPPPTDAIPSLCNALTADDFTLRSSIAMALAKLGRLARPALPALGKAADREISAGSSLHAATAIATIDPDSPEAQALLVPLAVRLRDSPVGYSFRDTGSVLSRYGPSAVAAVPTLRQALTSKDVGVRRQAAYLLGKIGPAAKAALPDLAALSQDMDALVRMWAAEAIKKIDVPSTDDDDGSHASQ